MLLGLLVDPRAGILGRVSCREHLLEPSGFEVPGDGACQLAAGLYRVGVMHGWGVVAFTMGAGDPSCEIGRLNETRPPQAMGALPLVNRPFQPRVRLRVRSDGTVIRTSLDGLLAGPRLGGAFQLCSSLFQSGGDQGRLGKIL